MIGWKELAEEEARINFDIVNAGGELTIPLSRLNANSKFVNGYKNYCKEKDKLKICVFCGKEFLIKKTAREKLCSTECKKLRMKEAAQRYYKTQKYQDFLAQKRKIYAECPEVRKREKETQKKYNSKPEIIAKHKANYLRKKNREAHKAIA